MRKEKVVAQGERSAIEEHDVIRDREFNVLREFEISE